MPTGHDVRRLTPPSEGEDLCPAGSWERRRIGSTLTAPPMPSERATGWPEIARRAGSRRKSLMRTIPMLWSPSPVYFTAACSSSSRRR
jgi:hypothetical protein